MKGMKRMLGSAKVQGFGAKSHEARRITIPLKVLQILDAPVGERVYFFEDRKEHIVMVSETQMVNDMLDEGKKELKKETSEQ